MSLSATHTQSDDYPCQHADAVAPTVTSTPTAGSRKATVTDLGLSPLAYSNAAGLGSGTMTLTAADATGLALVGM